MASSMSLPISVSIIIRFAIIFPHFLFLGY
jgi:hypothetical protein